MDITSQVAGFLSGVFLFNVAPEIKKGLEINLTPCFYLVGRARFERATNGLKVRCSTG